MLAPLDRAEKFGLRLDNRKDLTKTDWFMWTGAFGTDAYFTQVVDFVFAQLGADNTNKPLTDLYNSELPPTPPLKLFFGRSPPFLEFPLPFLGVFNCTQCQQLPPPLPSLAEVLSAQLPPLLPPPPPPLPEQRDCSTNI